MDPKLATALEGLRDIHLPAPISFWPPAPGWWALALLLLVCACATLWIRRRRRIRRLALHELAALEARFSADPKPVELAVSLTALIRRVALRTSTRPDVASLHGEPWVEFLTVGAKSEARAPHVVRDLFQTAYGGQRAESGEPAEWLAFARCWIREVA